MATVAAANPFHRAQTTSRPQLDQMIRRLQDGSRGFARLSLPERISLARSMQAGYLAIARESVAAACAAKGVALGTSAEGEEWFNPWSVVRHLRLVAEALTALARKGNTPIGPVSRTVDGRLAVQVFPVSPVDRVLFPRITTEVHLATGQTEEEMTRSRARWYKSEPLESGPVLVLGAGNMSMIPAMDVITKLFNEGKVCLLKMNPVNAYHGPFIETAFAEPIARGFLAVAYGGAEEGAHLVQHPGIAEVHLTGSDRTYDAMVWGPAGPERELRKARNTPALTKPVTAELGNVSPVLVVPGPYSDKELSFQAEAIAGAVITNASCVCTTPRVVLSPSGWSGRERLMAGLERIFTAAPVRSAYYPGADERWRKLTRGRTELHLLGSAGEGELPWTLLPDLDHEDTEEPAFAFEPFCPVLSEVAVGSDDPLEFLTRAVEFANQRLWGTLTASIVVHPQTMADPSLGPAVETAITQLRYGTVAVNGWAGLSYSLTSPPWGAYPGSSPADIQSGTGWVHNTPMLERIEKVVLRHPVTSMPKPASFPSHRTVLPLMQRLTAFEERASWTKLPGVIAAAMRA